MNDYLEINRKLWDKRTSIHLESDFYDMPSFMKGKSSLKTIEMDLLGDISGKEVLHLQCHFGQDSISLARMGASVTGADLSEASILKAKELASELKADARFICCDLYRLPELLDKKFDLVFTSYGTIGWLPDLDRWASVITHFLKPGGQLLFVEFHPFVWMYDADFKKIEYRYFKSDPIIETEISTYADQQSDVGLKSVGWNHGISEVIEALLGHGLQIAALHEYDYSPYNCFKGMLEYEAGRFRIPHLGDKVPMVYAISAKKI
jgi:SAM-dependent methyltransferase